MYAHKPIPGHKRMQPTARVNRVLHNKPGTLVVDIFGPAYPGSTAAQPPAPAPARNALVRGCHRRKLLHIQTLRISFRAAWPARIQQRRKSCRRIQAGSAQHTAANRAGAPAPPHTLHERTIIAG